MHISRKFFRPIMSHPHGLKFFPAKNFGFESWYARIFLPRKFFRPKFFGSKFENIKKCWIESWKKKVLVTQLTHVSVVNPAMRTRHRDRKTRTFFGREIFKTKKISG